MLGIRLFCFYQGCNVILCMASTYVYTEIAIYMNTQHSFISLSTAIETKVYIFITISLMSLNSCIYVTRADTESTSEHLEALRKLASDLEEQRETLEDLRDQRQAILPRLSLLDKELVKQQVRTLFFSITVCVQQYANMITRSK